MAVVPLGAIPWVEMVVGSQEEASRKKKRNRTVPKAEYTLDQPQTKSQSSSITLQKGKDAGMPNIIYLKSYLSVHVSV